MTPAKDQLQGLPRRKYSQKMHADPCTYGLVVSLYIFRKRKWLKIGEYCKRCGTVAIFPEFKKGIVE